MCLKLYIGHLFCVLVVALVTAEFDEDDEWFYEFDAENDEQDCPDVNSKAILPDMFYSSSRITMGVPQRSLRTLPDDWLVIRESGLPDSGLGVFATRFIPAHTWLAEYEGEIVTTKETNETSLSYEYMWTVSKSTFELYYVDAIVEETSNWLRYVNCPVRKSQENVWSLFCYGKVYYYASRNLWPGQELFVYYGDDYAEELGINVTSYYYS